MLHSALIYPHTHLRIALRLSNELTTCLQELENTASSAQFYQDPYCKHCHLLYVDYAPVNSCDALAVGQMHQGGRPENNTSKKLIMIIIACPLRLLHVLLSSSECKLLLLKQMNMKHICEFFLFLA